MKYEKVRAKSASKCAMEVRKAYGDDAIILGTRKVKEGGLFGSNLLSHELYEMEFMVMEKKSAQLPIRESVKSLGNRGRTTETTVEILKNKTEAKGLVNLGIDNEDPLEKQAIRRLLNDEDPIVESEVPFDVASDSSESIQKEPFENLPVAFSSELPETLDLDERSTRHFLQIRRNLISSHLSPHFADTFLGRLDHNLSRSQKQEYHKVISYSRQKLAELIQTVPDIAPPPGQCRGVLFMGPTGAGKTTTLAKIAAKYYDKRDVSIYSLDHYRLAATEQLKSYADVMGLPFHAPRDAEELVELIRRDGAEIVLIDSSGIGYRDTLRMERLYDFVDAIKNEIRLEKHLCLAANLAHSVLENILLAYDTIGFDKIILTKLDEADFIGAFIELADKFNRPFSFLCDGQEVPNNIAEADSSEIARMVLDSNLNLVAR